MDHTKQLLRISDIAAAAPDVLRYRFTAAEGKLAPFLPGQYMASVLVVAGVLLSQWGGQKGRREES